MAFVKIFFLLLIFCIFILNIKCARKQSITRFDRFDLCGCSENCIVQNFESQLRHPDRDNTLMHIKFTLTQDVPKYKLVVVPERCKNNDALDSCESTSNFNADDGCAIMNLQNVMWTPFVDSFTPPFKCPFRKGLYVSVNSTFDADMYKILPLQGWFYKSRLDMYNATGKNYLWSFCLGFRVVNFL